MLSNREIIDFINAHKQELRKILQVYGTEYRRGQDPDYWINLFRREFFRLDGANVDVVVDDCRFVNEMDMVRRLGGYDIQIEITPELEQELRKSYTGLDAPHQSETGLESIPDFIIRRGETDTAQQVRFIVKQVLANPSPVKNRRKFRSYGT